MRFGDLDHMSLDEFVASAPQEALWFFVHVPKTAGSSFSAEMDRDVQPYANIFVDYTTTRGYGANALVDAVEAFIARPDFLQHRSASGHMPLDVSRRVREARPETEFFSVLRSPVARVVSDYRYQRTPEHPPYREFMETFPHLADFVEHGPAQNKMARFLTGERIPTINETLRLADDEYAFIGLLEMYPMSFNVLFSLMGHSEKMPVEHRRRTPDTEATRVELTPELEARIKEVNAVDVALYEHVRQRLLKHRDAWRDMLRSRTEATLRTG